MHEALLNQIRLDDILDRIAGFTDGRRQALNPRRPAIKALHQCRQQLAVHHVEAFLVHIQQVHGRLGHGLGHVPIRTHLGIVPDTAQQPIGHPGRASGAPGDLHGAAGIQRHTHNIGGSRDNLAELFERVELKPMDDAEAVAQRRGQRAGPGGCAHQRERRQVQFDRPCGRPLANHNVELVVLHRRVQHLFDHRAESMNFINKQHVVGFEIRQQRSQIARLFQHRSGCLAQPDTHFGGDDMGQRGLSEAGGAKDQHMIQRFTTLPRGLDENSQAFAHRRLSDIVGQLLGADRPINTRLFAGSGAVDNARLAELVHEATIAWPPAARRG